LPTGGRERDQEERGEGGGAGEEELMERIKRLEQENVKLKAKTARQTQLIEEAKLRDVSVMSQM